MPTRKLLSFNIVLTHAAPVAAAATVLVWAAKNGGFPATTWLPGGILIAGLLIVQATGRSLGLGRDKRTGAVVALTAYGLFEAASILWAGSKGDAWDAANRTLIYALILALFAGWNARRESKHGLALVFVFSMAAVAVWSLISASHNVTSSFFGGRLAAPTGYPNATAALFLISFWPAVSLASGREKSPGARAAALGAAAMLAGAAWVPVSRGALYTFPVVALIFVALSPLRLRAVLAIALALLPVAMALDVLSGPWNATAAGERAPATTHAWLAVLACGAIAAVLGAAWSVIDRRVTFALPAWSRGGLRALLLAAVVSVVIVAAATHNPRAAAHNAWSSFRSTESSDVGGTRFGSLGSNRYDFWRVALGMAADHPIVGVGAGNFSEEYLLHRRSAEQPEYPHSIEFSVLSQTGAIGTSLFCAFATFAFLATLRQRRTPAGSVNALTAGAAAGFASWILHGSVDWLWEFPALGGSAFIFLGLAISDDGPPRGARPVRIVAIAAAAAIAASLLGPWSAVHLISRASGDWRASPSTAYAELDRAADFNPLSEDPYVVQTTIAAELGDAAQMETSARRALARNPHSWFERLQLAVALTHRKSWVDARAEAAHAGRLDPGEPLVQVVIAAISKHRSLDLRTVNDEVLLRIQALDPRLRKPTGTAG